MPATKINEIGIHVGDDSALNGDRLFAAHIAEPDTPRGQYDDSVELRVSNSRGYIPRDELRKVARREMRRSGQKHMEIRRIQRLA